MNGPVVVTGIGTIGSWGTGYDLLCRSLELGAIPTAEVEGAFHRSGDPRSIASVPANLTAEVIKPLIARRMSPPSRFAVCAALLATKDALVAASRDDSSELREAAVCIGTAWGSTTYTMRLLQQLETEGPESISPFLFMETVANAAAGQVALAVGATGPNLTHTQRESSAICALARGAALVESGRVRRALVGVTDEISPILHAVLARFGSVTRSASPAPFGAARGGLLPAEGSTVLVLEPESAARDRGAPLRARLRAFGRANDPTASATDWGTGAETIADRMRRSLEGRGLAPLDIGRVVSGAAGTRRGDALEAQVLDRLFLGKVPTVLTPKAITGEYGGGFLASALWGLTADRSPASPGADDPDLTLPVRPHCGGSIPRADVALVTALASGGAAAWAVFERVE